MIERSHWNNAYRRGLSELSWYQAEPLVSLELIETLGVQPDEAVVDVGGGTSPLADRLVERCFTDITVLDIAESALAEARRRLSAATDAVTWLAQDVRSWRSDRRYGLWHDRATFHFLIDPTDQDRYFETLDRALEPDGAVIIATFATDGPDSCSGLPVVGYDAASLARLLGPGFKLVKERREEHATPRGAIQPFTWVALRRRR